MSFIDFLNSIYLRYGYFSELLVNLYFEGASGSAKIRSILESYRTRPPHYIGDFKVLSIKDFKNFQFSDADGKKMPHEDFYLIKLDNGYSYGVRGSGTEPKIKFYLFAKEPVHDLSCLEDAKKKANCILKEMGQLIEADAHRRALES